MSVEIFDNNISIYSKILPQNILEQFTPKAFPLFLLYEQLVPIVTVLVRT